MHIKALINTRLQIGPVKPAVRLIAMPQHGEGIKSDPRKGLNKPKAARMIDGAEKAEEARTAGEHLGF